MDDYSLLLPILNETFESSLDYIKEKVSEFENQVSKPFHIFELSEQHLVVLKKTDVPIHYLNVGFPFPLLSKDIQIKNLTSVRTSINVFLRGEQIRKIQREKYFSVCNSKIEYADYNTKRIKINKIIYIDPYTFIGDSFIGLHFIDEVSKEYMLRNDPIIQIISRQYLELEEFYTTQPYSLITANLVHSDQNTLIIMPDLIDSHFEFCFEFLKILVKKPFGAIEIIGRNLKIVNEEDTYIYIHNTNNDTLLKDSNIEDYMDECINPLKKSTNSNKLEIKTNKNRSQKILINPFSSTNTKYIPVKIFSELLKIKQSQNELIQWEIVGGMIGRKDDFFWIKNFLSNPFVEENIDGKLKIKHYANLKVLIKKLKLEKFKFGITADTSIAHILNMTLTPQITIYNTIFWDTTSIQSLASDSPLGFSRYNINQFPIINNGEYEIVSKTIVDCMNFLNENTSEKNFIFIENNKEIIEKLFKFIGSSVNDFKITDVYKETKLILASLKENSNKYEASWMLDAYPIEYLLEDCINLYPEKSIRLFESYLKTSPLFKVFSMYESKIN